MSEVQDVIGIFEYNFVVKVALDATASYGEYVWSPVVYSYTSVGQSYIKDIVIFEVGALFFLATDTVMFKY